MKGRLSLNSVVIVAENAKEKEALAKFYVELRKEGKSCLEIERKKKP